MYPMDTCSNKKVIPFYLIGDFSFCLRFFALLVLAVRLLPPTTLPSGLDTTIRESPRPPVLEGHPRCIGRDFDEIFQAAWLVPPWTSRAACGSSQTFSRPFCNANALNPACPEVLHAQP